jgi:mediator of RNA polymerase II transcription subunit 14
MGELKRLLSVSKTPAADLKTTLEILSTGKAEWYSDLGYIRPTPYKSSQLLKALRTVNTLLTIRLNTQEEIPLEMMDFTIASGRATFRVKDEFELDLSIADEDPASQLFFIDFRFSFAPCMAEVPEGPLRDHVEGRTNDVLKREGLAGCYDFLHGLVMTHKLTILRQQAVELARGRWTENIRVELVHRSLVIQYWTNRPGHKSWIEIGARQRSRKAPSFSDEPSHLSLRWHRHGKEVFEHNIEIDAANLSVEKVLKEVVAQHTNHIFRHIKAGLKQSSVYSKGQLSVKHRAHPREPAESSLKMEMTETNTVTIVQEPVSGFFAISPSSELHYRAERDINRLRDPASEAASRMAMLRCHETLVKVHPRARMRRWQKVQTIVLNQETIQKRFGNGILRYALYRLPKWPQNWALALTSGPGGDKWWAVEIQDPPRKLGPVEIAAEGFSPVRRALQVLLNTSRPDVFEASYESLSWVEKSAAAVISQFCNARELTREKMQYQQKEPVLPLPNVKVPDYFIKLKPQSTAWCHDIVKSSYLGLSRTSPSTTSLVTLRLLKPIPNVRNIASAMDSGVAFQPNSGEISFRLRTPLGVASVPELFHRVERIASLVRFIETTTRHSLMISKISLNSVTIQYAPAHSTRSSTALTAAVHFPVDSPKHITLEKGNPHLRILDSLNQALNANAATGFQHVLAILDQTMSLMWGLNAIESLPHPGVSLHVLTRSATCIGVRYTGTHVAVAYEIRLRQKPEEGLVWFADMSTMRSIEAGSTALSVSPEQAAANKTTQGAKAPSSAKPTSVAAANSASANANNDPSRALLERRQAQALQKAWFELTRGRDEGWYGLGGGIVAQLRGASTCVQKLHEGLCKAVVDVDEMRVEDRDNRAEVKSKGEVKSASGQSSGQSGGQSRAPPAPMSGPQSKAPPAMMMPVPGVGPGLARVQGQGPAKAQGQRQAPTSQGQRQGSGQNGGVANNRGKQVKGKQPQQEIITLD